jgi:S-adenosylmethionine:tRNA ribosyltransferase-isomerase
MSLPDLQLLSSWQFELPKELIASRPTAVRDESRLLVIDRQRKTITHSHIRQLPAWLHEHDLLVFNNTKVLPARLFGFRTATGGRWEGLYVEGTPSGHWHILSETRGRLLPGETITVLPSSASLMTDETGDGLHEPSVVRSTVPEKSLVLTLLEKRDDGGWIVAPSSDVPAVELLEEFGSLPLPPYMGRKLADADDRERYQTQFASVPGAVAAPTAGLHFTTGLLDNCRAAGVRTAELTLHVGIGTFRPVSVSNLAEHRMHEEWCRLPPEACAAVAEARQHQGRVVAVGTTSIRTLESAALSGGIPLSPWQGRTSLFIQPGFQFRAVDCLLTNFHLPGSTLLVLVAALAGYDLIMEAYRQAIAERYRFYSYGDAMLIV